MLKRKSNISIYLMKRHPIESYKASRSQNLHQLIIMMIIYSFRTVEINKINDDVKTYQHSERAPKRQGLSVASESNATLYNQFELLRENIGDIGVFVINKFFNFYFVF